MNPANLTDCMKCGTPLKEEMDNERKDEPPKQQPPQIPQGKPVTQEPRRIVVPKRIIRKVEEKPQGTGGQADQRGSQNNAGNNADGNQNQ